MTDGFLPYLTSNLALVTEDGKLCRTSVGICNIADSKRGVQLYRWVIVDVKVSTTGLDVVLLTVFVDN